MGWESVLESFWQDFRYAGRTLARKPRFSAVAVFTLALGIGANIAILTVVNAVLLRSLQYLDANRIVSIRHHAPGLTLTELQSSPGLIAYYRHDARMLTRIAAFEMRDTN